MEPISLNKKKSSSWFHSQPGPFFLPPHSREELRDDEREGHRTWLANVD